MTTEAKDIWPAPLPTIDSDSKAYWEAAREGYLALPYCQSCNQYFFYPRAICPNCQSDQVEMKRASGKGTIYSYTVVRRHPNPAFNARVPYAVGLIDLAEGPRMLSAIRAEVSEVKIGAAVEVVFEELTPEVTLPCFKLA
jgi:uncharacterized OB-fold protein